MTEYNAGDKLTFERGTSRIVAKVAPGNVGVYFESLPGSANLGWMDNMGWHVVSVERATPPLPTEPGLYLSITGGVWQIYGEYGLISVSNPGMCPDPAEFAPFTRLEPVPDTAKKVLQAIEREYSENYLNNEFAEWNKVAVEFGVVSE